MDMKSTASKEGKSLKIGFVKAGKIGRLFGVNGGMSIKLYEQFPEQFDLKEPLWVFIDSLAVPLFMDEFQWCGNNGARVRFADIDTSLRAQELIGLDFYLKNSQSDNNMQIGFQDLEGYVALIYEEDKDLEIKGVINAFVDNPINPLLVIDVAGREVLLPASEDLCEYVDVDEHEVCFIVPEGLVELNE